MTPEQLPNNLKAALHRLAVDPQPIQLTMSKADAFTIIGTIQLASRHPAALTSPTVQAAIGITRQIINIIAANDNDLKLLCNMGFERQFDEPANDKPVNTALPGPQSQPPPRSGPSGL